MADHDATRPPGGRGEALPGPATPESRRRTSHETGESSTTGSRLDTTPATDQTLDAPDASPRHVRPSSAAPARREIPIRTQLRQRPVSSFLLHDSVLGHRDARRRPVRDAARPDAKAPQTPEARHRHGGLGVSSDAGSRRSTPSSRDRSLSGIHVADTASAPPSPQQGAATLDVDAAQIVHMALSLSESRRLAARRNASRGTPPRLVSLPDASSGSNLRQHLQQQRRCSRNMSPISQPSPAKSSAARLSSHVQSALDTGHDAQYGYDFSASTLSRAQRAKEHLELMAEYRRLLEVLPPLKPGFERYPTASLPSSPVTSRAIKFGSHKSAAPALGRQYNPLQFIRNRKVRARERKVIDAERQGFGDVESVRSWVDEICLQASPSSLDMSSDEAGPALPAFPGADDPESRASTDAAASRAAARVRRPRVDWFIEPCDMIADTYWLEQDYRHKQLIEGRQWRKIFPPSADVSRPMSRETGIPNNTLTPQTEIHPDVRADTEPVNTSAKHRARQKLQSIRTFPHRHSGSLHGHHRNSVGLKKDSASDISDSENEAKDGSGRKVRLARSGTLTSNTNDLLEKQMLEMVAKEARERELVDATMDHEQIVSPTLLSPDRNLLSEPSSRFHSRKGSMADTSDSDRRGICEKSQLAPPHRLQLEQRGLDVSSTGQGSSLPTSPELRALRDASSNVEPGTISTPFSPIRSRPESPSRNPLSKIKHIILDRNTDTESGAHAPGPDQDGDRQQESSWTLETLAPSARRPPSPSKHASERPSEPRSMQKRSGSLRPRPDDHGVGLRGIFKGPRLDTVIRGGVSKLGDMLWRKDGSSAPPPLEVDSTDESEGEGMRGRQRPPLSLSRRQSQPTQGDGRQAIKQLLDVMPDFSHTPGSNHAHSAGNGHAEETPDRLSSRIDLLKSPRIDTRNVPGSVSRHNSNARLVDSNVSEPESWPGSMSEGIREADKGPDGALVAVTRRQHGQRQSRHWSIADKGCSTEQTRLSRREIARMRVLILSSGIKAMEISRRANELHRPFGTQGGAATGPAGIAWADVARLSPEQEQLREHEVALCELYPFAARTLGSAMQASGQRWQAAADALATTTSPALRRRMGALRSRLVDELSEMTRRAADEADETGRDLALGQPLKIKHVVDTMDKMLRRRRRRLRWLRRALWLMVEWLLVGFMWYVWFVVVILRVALGTGKGVVRGVRWLLWM